MTPKQQRFIEEYLVDLNATQAAIRAGYSGRSAEVEGHRLLRNAKVLGAILQAQSARSERTQVTQDQVLADLAAIAFADPNELIQWRRGACPSCRGAEEQTEEHEGQPHGGSLKRIRKAAPRVDEIDPNCEVCGGEGAGRVYIPDTRHLTGAARRLYAGVKQTKDGLQVMMRSQDRALELLGDHLGLFKKVQVSGPNGGPIETHDVGDLSKLPREKRDAVRAAIKEAMKS